MKEATISHLHPGWFIMPLLALVLALAPLQAQADTGYEPYSREELAQMLAPIALYPDALLAQVLMASTYPVEVIEADHWVRMNPHFTGEALDVALLNQDWDPSVKAICHFPSILAQMSARISETTHLGNAFLDQEAEVMAMVQQLRHQAYAQGHLTTTARQQVIVERETIIIRPADYRVIYVPYYDPWRVYGTWWYPAYPPYSWGPPGGRISYVISYWPGVHFSFSFGTWSYFDWPRRIIHIDVVKRPRFVRHDQWLVKSGPWQHAPGHRHGVARDRSAARKIVEYRPHYRHVRGEDRGYSGYRRDSDRRDHDRRVTGRDQPRADSEIGRDRTGRERFERPRQEREQAERQRPGQRQEQPPVARDRQPRIAVGDERKPPVQVERERRGNRDDASTRVQDRRGRRSGEIGRQEPGVSEIRSDRPGGERLERPRREHEPAERHPGQQRNDVQQRNERQRQGQPPAVERDRQTRTAAGDGHKPPVQVERERRGNREDASTRVEDRRGERGEIARIGRPEPDGDRGRGRSGGSGQGGDDNRDRNRRER